MVPAADPTRTLDGARVETVGKGLLTCTLLPASAGNNLRTVHNAELENRALLQLRRLEIVARISVLLMNVVWTLTPESWITEFGVNPVPVTSIVTADEPTGTSLGVTDAMASAPRCLPRRRRSRTRRRTTASGEQGKKKAERQNKA